MDTTSVAGMEVAEMRELATLLFYYDLVQSVDVKCAKGRSSLIA
jgi:hypothetical protein